MLPGMVETNHELAANNAASSSLLLFMMEWIDEPPNALVSRDCKATLRQYQAKSAEDAKAMAGPLLA